MNGWDAAVVLAKAVAYAATLGAAGEVAFLVYCRDLLERSQAIPLRRMVAVLSITAAVASAFKILLLAGSMSGEWSGMVDRSFTGMILAAGEARATGARLLGLLLMGAILSSDRRLNVLAVLGATLAATSFALTGHAHAQLPQFAPTLLLCIHLLCIAFWLGALPALLRLTSGGNRHLTARCTARFGDMAAYIVAILILAGAYVLYALLAQISDLWNSDYGRLLIAKLLLVALLLVAAAVNKLRLTPRLLNGEPHASQQLRRSIQAELVLAAFILLVTAAFTTLTGPTR